MALSFDNLNLNASLNLEPYFKAYQEKGIVQIPDIFDDSTAGDIYQLLLNNVPWRTLFTDKNNEPVHYDELQWAAIDKHERERILTDVYDRASQNLGYHYKTYPMIEAYMRGWNPGHEIHALTEFINSDKFLSIGRGLTRNANVRKADAHATRYGPGDFLTRHLDLGEDLERRAAYVLGFADDWQPDWGGLLLFLNEKQDVTEGYLPRFNTLTVFDIKYLHTVTQVSSFAGGLRLAITGWFRDDALNKPQG